MIIELEKGFPETVARIQQLAAKGELASRFNTGLFVNGASSRPEAAGVGVALIGSFFMMLIVLRSPCRLVWPRRSIWKSLPRRTV